MFGFINWRGHDNALVFTKERLTQNDLADIPTRDFRIAIMGRDYRITAIEEDRLAATPELRYTYLVHVERVGMRWCSKCKVATDPPGDKCEVCGTTLTSIPPVTIPLPPK